ncbi:MAG: hypothetical protein ACM3ZE_20280 [Myxococcales bacterium]
MTLPTRPKNGTSRLFVLWLVAAGLTPSSPANAGSAGASATSAVQEPATMQPDGDGAEDETSEAGMRPPSMPHARGPSDSVENSESVPAGTIDVTVLDMHSNAAVGTQLELLRDRQSITQGNSSSKREATTDATGKALFANVQAGSDSQYRVVVLQDGARYGTHPFPINSRMGTKVVIHAYPVVRDIKQSLVLGRGFFFVEPRDQVVSIEYMQEFHNLGQTVLVANDLSLRLPENWKAFATSATDSDLTVVSTAEGVSLSGAIAPGKHSVMFTFQLPTANQDRLALELALFPHTAEAQLATFVRPGLELHVDGFPAASVNETAGRQPLLVTGRSFARDRSAPGSVRAEISGLPTLGPGRWVAVALSSALAALALLFAFKRREAAPSQGAAAAARDRIVDELAALERMRRRGDIGETAFADTRETLLSAFVRAAREADTRP